MVYAEKLLRRYQINFKLRYIFWWCWWLLLATCSLGWLTNATSSITPHYINLLNGLLGIAGIFVLFRKFPNIRKLRLKDYRNKKRSQLARLDFLSRRVELVDAELSMTELHRKLKEKTTRKESR